MPHFTPSNCQKVQRVHANTLYCRKGTQINEKRPVEIQKEVVKNVQQAIENEHTRQTEINEGMVGGG